MPFIMKKALVGLLLIVLVLSIPLTSFAYGVSVIIPDDQYATCRKVSTKRISFRCEVKNTNPSKRVKSYELTYYTADEYRMQNGPTEKVTLRQDIRPYETILSPEFFLSNSNVNNIYYVYVAVTRVRYDDGSTESDSSPRYFGWILKGYY